MFTRKIIQSKSEPPVHEFKEIGKIKLNENADNITTYEGTYRGAFFGKYITDIQNFKTQRNYRMVISLMVERTIKYLTAIT